MDFANRHIGPSPSEQAKMLAELGYNSLDDFVSALVPAGIRLKDKLNLPPAISEAQAQQRLREMSELNNALTEMIGLGYYGTVTPAVIQRNIFENPSWYTAYTPYQPEMSQGRLAALLNFQQMVADLTGLPIAGASLLDEATALAEAISMAKRLTRKDGIVLIDAGIFPQSLEVVNTRTQLSGIEVVVTDDVANHPRLSEAFALVVQTPNADGRLAPTSELVAIAEAGHQAGALVIAAADLLALTLVRPPGEWGADIAVGSTQRFGIPLFYGGPHAGYIAARENMARQLPGRLVGVSKDANGNIALRLALQTREQHIRRERATSNICTAQVLLAVMAGMYAVYHGPEGLKAIAQSIHDKAKRLAGSLPGVVHHEFFDTLLVKVDGCASHIVAAARRLGVHLRLVDENHIGIAVGEDSQETDLVKVAKAFGVELGSRMVGSLGSDQRTSSYLTNPVFNSYHSETKMMRYLHRLACKDYALDTGMIPLGSCTMKLTSASEMSQIAQPGFANLHPFVPDEDAKGYHQLMSQLSEWLIEITGYQACTFQPNSGAAGEYTGLAAIRRFHLANGQPERDVCLIPSSAHGTNAASAAMAGMRVVVIKACKDGQIDLADLAEKIAANEGKIAAVMVTYPSTHGAFEDTIKPICQQVHEAGGQVYVDGANLNALVGLAKPGRFGADVSHLNLHKTFAIPHGGGGPGVGPVLCQEHLAPFLPEGLKGSRVSASLHGSAGVLAISWAYIAMMGANGLTQASKIALLNANYIAHRLRDVFPVLYSAANGTVAHECIIDPRALTKKAHLTIDDIAKRLIDYGFHAPTMSFPVAGTLMIEPTESEDLGELDAFCDAMIAIRGEIDKIISGQWPKDDNPLANAPHTIDQLAGDEWAHPYPRSVAMANSRYWPPVGRIDNAYGDRNLICVCPPLSDHA